jgi:hypothetical protein
VWVEQDDRVRGCGAHWQAGKTIAVDHPALFGDALALRRDEGFLRDLVQLGS